jgi:ABC-type sugar transport system permease subunit
MNKLKLFKLPATIIAVVFIVSLAWILRWRAVTMLPIDYDEDDYLRAAQQYAALMRAGNWGGFLQTNYRQEHPPLAKIIFGLSILQTSETTILPDRPTSALPDKTLPREQVLNARAAGAILSTTTVGLLALVNPMAGLLLAMHAFTIKYVDQIMLEALPALTSLAMVMAYLQAKKSTQKTGWLALSAILLGLTAASKYLYCVAGIAILVDWALESRENKRQKQFIKSALLWGLLAILIFYAADPYLWPDPLGRLKESILFHANYTNTASEVKRANFPFWQPFFWLTSTPAQWHPGVFVFNFDPLITLLALLGLASLWNKARVYVLWLGIGIFFLLLWPTKWPQYILILTAPLSLAAAHGIQALVILPFQNWLAARNLGTGSFKNQERSQLRKALPWLVPGLLAFTVFTLFPLFFQAGVSLTDFNSVSIRDGLNGGIWRSVSEGLTRVIIPIAGKFPYREKLVNFIGFNTYSIMFNTILQNGTLIFNILWTILSVGLQTFLGMSAALLLWQRGIKLRRTWEMLFILPWAIPEMIGAQMWMNVFAPTIGWLSLAQQTYGENIPFAFLLGWERNQTSGLVVLLIAATWYGFPFMMLATSAGLKFLSIETLDAAQLDGANNWQTFRFVIWPLVLPLVLPAILIRGIFAFNQFYLFQAFHSSYNTLARLSYNYFNSSGSFINGQYAGSAVLNIITIPILIGFVFLFNRWSKAGQGVEYA